MFAIAATRLQSRLGRGLVVTAICVSLGLQWAVLQGVAWTGMLISYARDASLIEAVAKTFDGDHPCPLCKAVAKGQQQEQKQTQLQPPAKKFEAVLVTLIHIVPPIGEAIDYPASLASATQRAQAPPWNPPKEAAA